MDHLPSLSSDHRADRGGRRHLVLGDPARQHADADAVDDEALHELQARARDQLRGCDAALLQSDIIDANKPTELVPINVKAIRYDVADAVAKTCTTHLIERVHLTIRGIEFNHERFSDLGSRPFADCVTEAAPATTQPAGPGDKSDDPGASEAKAETGGCSATNGSSLFVLFLVGAAILLASRKRELSA